MKNLVFAALLAVVFVFIAAGGQEEAIIDHPAEIYSEQDAIAYWDNLFSSAK